MSKARKITAEERDEARAELRKMLKPGDTVWTVSRHTASSGMMRIIDLVIPTTRTDSYPIPAATAGKKLKAGAPAYATGTGANSYRTGKVEAFDASTVTIAYEATATSPAGAETHPVGVVKIDEKRTRPWLRSIGWLACKAMGDTWDSDRQGIKVGGCGMDMGFKLVYDLGHTLWPDGTPKPHGTRNGEPDSAGGYALKHSWL